MVIQCVRFSDGGYVLHKITGAFSGRVSAWFDKTGHLITCEQLIGERSRPVKTDAAIWQYVQHIGRTYGRLVVTK